MIFYIVTLSFCHLLLFILAPCPSSFLYSISLTVSAYLSTKNPSPFPASPYAFSPIPTNISSPFPSPCSLLTRISSNLLITKPANANHGSNTIPTISIGHPVTIWTIISRAPAIGSTPSFSRSCQLRQYTQAKTPMVMGIQAKEAIVRKLSLGGQNRMTL